MSHHLGDNSTIVGDSIATGSVRTIRFTPKKVLYTALLTGAFSVIFLLLCISPIASTDGSQMALTQALAYEKTPIINTFVKLTNRNDYAFLAGNYLSDRPPIYSAVAAPLVAVGALLGTTMPQISHSLATIPALVAVASIFAILWPTFIRSGLSRRQAILTLTLVACSPVSKYIFMALPHALSAALILHLVTTSCELPPQSAEKSALATASVWPGFLLGLLPFVRYENTFLVPILLFFLCQSPRALSLIPLLTGIAVGAMPGLLYHYRCFGSPLTTPGSFTLPDRNIWGESPATGRVGGEFTPSDFFPNLPGSPSVIFDLLFGSFSSGTGGLFLLVPILIPWSFGLWKMARLGSLLHRRALSVAVALLLVVSSQANVSGGLMRDGRYLLPCIPLLALGVSWQPLWRYMSDRIVAITGAIGLGNAIGRYLIASGADLATMTSRLCSNLTTAINHPAQTLLFMTASALTALALTSTHSSRIRSLLVSYITASITLFALILATMSPRHNSTFSHKGSAAHILSQRTGWVTPPSPNEEHNGSKRFTFNESAYFLFSPPPATPPIFFHQSNRAVIPTISLSSLPPAEVAKTYKKLASDGESTARIFTDGSAYLLVNSSAEGVVVECFE